MDESVHLSSDEEIPVVEQPNLPPEENDNVKENTAGETSIRTTTDRARRQLKRTVKKTHQQLKQLLDVTTEDILLETQSEQVDLLQAALSHAVGSSEDYIKDLELGATKLPHGKEDILAKMKRQIQAAIDEKTSIVDTYAKRIKELTDQSSSRQMPAALERGLDYGNGEPSLGLPVFNPSRLDQAQSVRTSSKSHKSRSSTGSQRSKARDAQLRLQQLQLEEEHERQQEERERQRD